MVKASFITNSIWRLDADWGFCYPELYIRRLNEALHSIGTKTTVSIHSNEDGTVITTVENTESKETT